MIREIKDDEKISDLSPFRIEYEHRFSVSEDLKNIKNVTSLDNEEFKKILFNAIIDDFKSSLNFYMSTNFE